MTVKVTVDATKALSEALKALAVTKVLVGIPSDDRPGHKGPGKVGTNARQPDPENKSSENNATIGYKMEYGVPEDNVPARPFLGPGIEKVKDDLAKRLGAAGRAALEGNVQAVQKNLHAVGLQAVSSVRATISEGIPPPLSERTLEGRAARGREGAAKELKNRAKGMAPSMEFAKPLIDTGQLRNSISYVLHEVANAED